MSVVPALKRFDLIPTWRVSLGYEDDQICLPGQPEPVVVTCGQNRVFFWDFSGFSKSLQVFQILKRFKDQVHRACHEVFARRPDGLFETKGDTSSVKFFPQNWLSKRSTESFTFGDSKFPKIAGELREEVTDFLESHRGFVPVHPRQRKVMEIFRAVQEGRMRDSFALLDEFFDCPVYLSRFLSDQYGVTWTASGALVTDVLNGVPEALEPRLPPWEAAP
jgi:hypothetical protein